MLFRRTRSDDKGFITFEFTRWRSTIPVFRKLVAHLLFLKEGGVSAALL